MKKNLILAISILLIACVTLNLQAQSIHGKSPLKVLFVGYDPSKTIPEFDRSYPGMMSKEEFIAEYPIRMPAFEKLLNEYFTEVKTIDCRDWKPSDSGPYDVTIFDFKTTPLQEAKTEKGTNGETKYIAAEYLPKNFSKPVVFISSTADEMGRSIGLKLDWLCLCLDADAHHVNTNHPIFNGPLEKVSPTLVMKKTPDGIYHYSTGASVPKEIPMWRVQKDGYLENSEIRIGLVSRGNRFADSPDAEVISSGVCTKDVGAVALGRHGNFFLWGFGASPAEMTDEAKKVFVNAVVYIKQFDGKPPIARKYNDRMATTDDVREIIANTSRKAYDEYVKELTEFNLLNAKEKKRIDDKKAAGLQLTSSEETSLQYLGHEQKIDSWEEFLKQRMGKFATQFGSDAARFQQFLTDNLNYVYCNPDGFYEFSIDEDVKHIGISNHDVKLLEKCVEMLKNNDQAQMAAKVLKRYTTEEFTTAKDWSNWLSKNKTKLFFTETGGYKFMVNSYN
jgi:hypothetical protein